MCTKAQLRALKLRRHADVKRGIEQSSIVRPPTKDLAAKILGVDHRRDQVHGAQDNEGDVVDSGFVRSKPAFDDGHNTLRADKVERCLQYERHSPGEHMTNFR